MFDSLKKNFTLNTNACKGTQVRSTAGSDNNCPVYEIVFSSCAEGNLFRTRHMGCWHASVCSVVIGICCYCVPRKLLGVVVPLLLSAAIC